MMGCLYAWFAGIEARNGMGEGVECVSFWASKAFDCKAF